SVTVAADGGGSVPTSRPVNDPSNQQIIHVRLGRPLRPGGYTVTWHVLSVDTHRTEVTYHFTVT
ncbi:MAG: copper resistance protein CopC, partial [Methylocella sp.]